ncbi:MAG: HNH endonuclease, partial [Sediminibacterium sp.]|nr:HNH endonuclease [Sediminibacterium sp.]
ASVVARLRARLVSSGWQAADIDLFLADFANNADALAKFDNGTLDFDVWKKFNSINHEIRKNADFLERYSKLPAEKQDKMVEFMSNQTKPAGFRTPQNRVNFDVTKTINIGDGAEKAYTVHYDSDGFPDFREFCPTPKTDFVYKPDAANGYLALEGNGNDFNRANAEMQKKFGNNPNFSLDGTGFQLNGVRYTWHHHQDGLTMFPVPSKIHTGTFPHSGGATLIENYKIIGFFTSPF